MGQKLVSILCNEGSAPNLWSPEYSPIFSVEVSNDGTNWGQVTEYCPNVPKDITFPVNGNTGELTNSTIKKAIRENQRIAFLVNDEVLSWRIRMKDRVLTEDQWRTLNSEEF